MGPTPPPMPLAPLLGALTLPPPGPPPPLNQRPLNPDGAAGPPMPLATTAPPRLPIMGQAAAHDSLVARGSN